MEKERRLIWLSDEEEVMEDEELTLDAVPYDVNAEDLTVHCAVVTGCKDEMQKTFHERLGRPWLRSVPTLSNKKKSRMGSPDDFGSLSA